MVGFDQASGPIVPTPYNVARHIQETTNLAEKTVVQKSPGSIVIDCETLEPRPYFIIANTTEEGTNEENEIIKKSLEKFGYDIEYGEIKDFFMPPDYESWVHVVSQR